jgi:integrase
MKAGSGSNVILKRGSYYFRRRVPVDLVEILGPGEVTKPLGTKVKREAARLARAYGARLDVGYALVRAGQVDSVDGHREWVRNFADAGLAKLQREVDMALEDSIGTDEADEVAEAYDEQLSLLTEGVADNEEWALQGALVAGGLDPDALPRDTWKVVAVGLLNAASGLKFSAIPTVPAPPSTTLGDAPTSPVVLDAIAALTAKVDAQGKAKDAKALGEALEVYARVKAEKREEPLEDTKLNDLYLVPSRFAAFVGPEKLMDSLQVTDVLAWLDAQQDKRSKTPKPIGSGTRNKFAGALSTFFDEAIKRNWATENPAKGLRVVRRSKAHERRQAFTTDELQKLFSAELRAEVERGFAERWWVPCIHLMNGTRTNEACQLKLRDIVEVDGIPCMRIMPEDAEQSTKTAESDRVVPLHPQLIEIGLLDYVEKRRAETGNDPTALLFPNLTHLKRAGYKTKVVNHFSGEQGYLNRVGIWVRDKKVLYSLRHTSLTAMERAEVSPLARTQLTGHARQGDQGQLTYISDRQAHDLLTELSKVSWNDAFQHVL